MIADANGLMGDETLSAGQVLTIPNKVHNSHNTSDVFRVYDPNEAIGNNSPTAPKPQKHHSGGCGGIGQILLAVVAAVVAFYVFPIALSALGATVLLPHHSAKRLPRARLPARRVPSSARAWACSPASSPSSTGARWR